MFIITFVIAMLSRLAPKHLQLKNKNEQRITKKLKSILIKL